jgi:polycomb protein EED
MSVSSSIPRYKFVNRILETHNAPIYYVQFNFSDLRYKDYFATIGSNFASIYKLEPQGIITPIYIFADADSNEQLYTCCWTSDTTTGDPLLVIAGNNGTIKVLNIHTCSMEKALLGHGAGVYELQRHPLDPRVIMSASQDGSARLWNLESGRCFVSFVGEQGHREAVLSCAFNLKGDRCATAGMDHMIKIWDLEILAPQIKRSRLPVRYPGSAEVSPLDSKVTDSNDLNEQDPPITIVQFPLFSTSKVHNNYVDCVRFMGDWILSKSAGQKIVLWRPLGSRGSYTVDRLQEYVFKECDIWFVRFGLDYRQRFLAVGNKVGDLFIWDAADVLANALQGRLCEGMQLSHKRATRAVRHVAFSFDCSSLLVLL